jgi:lipopolysaccharide export system protein LptC
MTAASLAYRGRRLLADIGATLLAYLPVALMGLLALGTWWLVRSTPVPEPPREPGPPRGEPDYAMEGFVVRRYGADGRLRAQIEGDHVHHFPDTDTLRIDGPRVRVVDAQGRVTVASARRATSNGDASELALDGDARVARDGAPGEPPMVFAGERIEASRTGRRIVALGPVVVSRGDTVLRADRAVYDHGTRVLTLDGRVRMTIGGGAAAAAVSPASSPGR